MWLNTSQNKIYKVTGVLKVLKISCVLVLINSWRPAGFQVKAGQNSTLNWHLCLVSEKQQKSWKLQPLPEIPSSKSARKCSAKNRVTLAHKLTLMRKVSTCWLQEQMVQSQAVLVPQTNAESSGRASVQLLQSSRLLSNTQVCTSQATIANR